MQEELKPCPFCGSEAAIIRARVRIKRTGTKKIVKKNRKIFYAIGCTGQDCILRTRGKSARLMFTASPRGREYMIRQWNRRKSDEE